MFELEKKIETDKPIVIKFNEQRKINYVNQIFQDLTGFEDKDIIGKEFDIILDKKNPLVIFGGIIKRLKTETSFFFVSKNLTKSKEIFWTVVYILPYHQDNQVDFIAIAKPLLSEIKADISKLYNILSGIEADGSGIKLARKFLIGWLEDKGISSLEEFLFEKWGSKEKLKNYLIEGVNFEELYEKNGNFEEHNKHTDYEEKSEKQFTNEMEIDEKMDIDDVLKYLKKQYHKKFW